MSLKKEMFNGVFWTAIQKYSGIVVQLIVTAILARLISPTDFGIIAIATVFIVFLNLFTDMGFGPAIIQNKQLSEMDLNNIFSTTVYGGFILSVLFFFSSFLIASFYENTSLILICQILSVNLLFSALNIVPNALVLKNKRFKYLAQITLFLQVTTGIISIIAALSGLGVYSLLISPVLTSIGCFILNFRIYPQKFYLRIRLSAIKKILSFSVYQFLFNFMNYFSRNLDNLIIGKYLSLSALGYYEKSYRLMMLPMQNITNVITPVMHPILSSLQNNSAELAIKYNKIVKLLGTISFPLGAFLFFTSSEIIHIVYGNNWDKAIPVFRILALSLPFQMILSPNGSIYQAAGKTDWLFYNGLSNTFFTVSGFIVSVVFFKTIEAFAWSWNITITINILISYIILYRIVLKSSIINMLKLLIIPAINFSLICIALIMFDFYLPDTNIFISLIIKTSIAFSLTCLCIQTGKQYDIYGLIKSKTLKKIIKKK